MAHRPISKPAGDHDAAKNPAALEANGPSTDMDTSDDEADGTSVSWTNEREHRGFAAMRGIVSGGMAFPDDGLAAEQRRDFKTELLYEGSEVLARLQLFCFKPAQKGIKEILKLVHLFERVVQLIVCRCHTLLLGDGKIDGTTLGVTVVWPRGGYDTAGVVMARALSFPGLNRNGWSHKLSFRSMEKICI